MPTRPAAPRAGLVASAAVSRTEPPPAVVLLPGMDGTALLGGPFRSALDPLVSLVEASYPCDELLDTAQLARRVVPTFAAQAREMHPTGRYVIVAQSFSGHVALKYAETRPPGLAGIVLVNAFTSTPLPALATRGLLAAQGPPEWMFQAQPPPEIVARALLGGGGPAAVDLARGLLVEFYPPPRRHHSLSGPSGENGAIFAVCTALCAVPGRPGCAAPTIVGVDVMEARTTDAALCGLCV